MVSLIAPVIILPNVSSWFEVRDVGVSLGTGVYESVRFVFTSTGEFQRQF